MDTKLPRIAVNGSTHPLSIRAFNGYTIIELMICIAILGVLSSIAIPSFAGMVSKSRISTTANDVLLALIQARNYAITNNKTVLVCQVDSANQERCNKQRASRTNWANGWLVYVDSNGDNELGPADSIISVHSASKGTSVVFNQRGRLRFFADGSARSAGFYVCQTNSQEARHIRLLYTGRARISGDLGSKQQAICKSKSAV